MKIAIFEQLRNGNKPNPSTLKAYVHPDLKFLIFSYFILAKNISVLDHSTESLLPKKPPVGVENELEDDGLFTNSNRKPTFLQYIMHLKWHIGRYIVRQYLYTLCIIALIILLYKLNTSSPKRPDLGSNWHEDAPSLKVPEKNRAEKIEEVSFVFENF